MYYTWYYLHMHVYDRVLENRNRLITPEVELYKSSPLRRAKYSLTSLFLATDIAL